jgi:hypothetical protein
MEPVMSTSASADGPCAEIEFDWRRVMGVSLVLAVVVLGWGAARAWASTTNPACPGADSSTATSCTFTTAGMPTFTVPAGVHSLDVVAVGAAGGNDDLGNAGGLGASVEDTAVPVSAGQALGVTVGGVGGTGQGQEGGAPGSPGGGGAGGQYPTPDTSQAAAEGGGGGGFSGVLDPSGNPLVIGAGGGGGGGAGGPGGAGDTGAGGQPGSSSNGCPGNDHLDGGGANGSTGGQGGSGTSGGGDGEPGGSLSGGQGGADGPDGSHPTSGGGGGGGYAGGGGGGGGGGCAGGGGGGSSYGVGAGLSNEQTASAPASVTISWLPAPTISTTQQPSSVTVGSQVADQATVSGGNAPTGTVTFNLYNNSSASGTPLFTDTESLSGGSATSKGYATTATGTDYWVATFSGDANNESESSGTSAEPVTVGAASPSIATSQQPSSATVGSQVADQATVSGGDSPTGTVTFKLYGNATASGTPLFTDTEPLSGGSATSKGYTTTATGTDYWVATYNGDANNNSVSSSTSGEPVTITTASKLADLSIAISGPSGAADGASFAERVTVSNAGPASAGNVLTALLVPAGVTVTSTGGGTVAGGVVYWTAAQIASHAKATYTVTFKVSAHARGTVLIPAATASLANPDHNYANNAATTTVTLSGRSASSASARRAHNPLAVGKRLPALLWQLTHRHRLHHEHR